MKKRARKPTKSPPVKDQQSFEQQVAELKAELEKLPTDRQRQFEAEFDEEKEQ